MRTCYLLQTRVKSLLKSLHYYKSPPSQDKYEIEEKVIVFYDVWMDVVVSVIKYDASLKITFTLI